MFSNVSLFPGLGVSLGSDGLGLLCDAVRSPHSTQKCTKSCLESVSSFHDIPPDGGKQGNVKARVALPPPDGEI